MENRERLNLERELRKHEFCAVIEVTNGVARRYLHEKATQAKNGRTFITNLLDFQLPVYAGIIFYKNFHASSLNSADLDFLLELPELQSEQIERALADIKGEDSERAKRTITQLLRCGENPNHVLYPSRAQWERLREIYKKQLGRMTREEYLEFISGPKGPMLERHVKHYLSMMPFVRGPIQMETGDIDVIVAGPEALVLGRLNNPEYFKRHIRPEPVPK